MLVMMVIEEYCHMSDFKIVMMCVANSLHHLIPYCLDNTAFFDIKMRFYYKIIILSKARTQSKDAPNR